ncbi:MAG: hypothetical protein QE264_02705 [Flavobacterium sp.]|jgi:hypothetical protein|nr:hypothetical protein [Flavobacterium sp.]
MKTNSILKVTVLFAVILFASCTKDNNDLSSAFTAADIQTNAKLDQVANDLSDIIDDQYFTENPAGKTIAPTVANLLPPCVTVTRTVTSTSWTRTVDFGTTGCAMPNGAILRGIITMTGSLPYTTSGYVITYSFNGFRYNDFLVQGNRTVTRSLGTSTYQVNIHPICVMDMNMTFTNATGVYTRVGTRTRECVEGNATVIWTDNVYVVTGNWTTTFPNGNVHTNAISNTTPIRVRLNCDYRVVSGTVNITRPNHTAVLDYGNGTCDNIATISIDGGTPVTITF